MDTDLACYLAGYMDAETLERSAFICMKENLFPINESNYFIPIELI